LSELVPEKEPEKADQLAKLSSIFQSIFAEDVDTFFASILTGGPVDEAILNVVPEELNHVAESLIDRNKEFLEKSVPHLIQEGTENLKNFISATQENLDNCGDIEEQFLTLLEIHLPLIFELWERPEMMRQGMSASLSSSMFLQRSHSFDFTSNKKRPTPYEPEPELDLTSSEQTNHEEEALGPQQISQIEEDPVVENKSQMFKIANNGLK